MLADYFPPFTIHRKDIPTIDSQLTIFCLTRRLNQRYVYSFGKRKIC